MENDDEFMGGIWWVPAGGQMRSATLGECCAEIKRLRAELKEQEDLIELQHRRLSDLQWRIDMSRQDGL